MISLFRSVFNGTLGFVFTARSFASNFVVASLFIYSGWQCGKKEMDSEICYTKSQTDIRRHKSDGTIGPDRRLISQQPIVFKCIFGSCQSTCKSEQKSALLFQGTFKFPFKLENRLRSCFSAKSLYL